MPASPLLDDYWPPDGVDDWDTEDEEDGEDERAT